MWATYSSLRMLREIGDGAVDVDAVAGTDAEAAGDIDRTADVVVADREVTGETEADPRADAVGNRV